MKGKRITAVIALVLSLCFFGCMFAGCDSTPVPATVALNKTTAEVYVGETTKLTATVSDKDGEKISDVEVIWSSSDETIATVSGGTVKGVKDGKATITATVNELTATCEVSVSTRQTVTINEPEDLTLVVGSKDSLTLTAVATDNSEITWKSSDETVAKVENGVVTAQSTAGQKTEVTITATSATAGSDSCTVTVYNNGSAYEIVRNSSNANVIADPGVWYWFAKNAAAEHYGFTEEKLPTYTNGTIDISMAFLEADESNSLGTDGVVQWELRYQPIFAADTAYTMTFTLTTNTDITLRWANVDYDYAAGTHEVTFTGAVNASFPANIRLMTAGGTAEEPLETPINITMANIVVAEAVAEAE